MEMKLKNLILRNGAVFLLATTALLLSPNFAFAQTNAASATNGFETQVRLYEAMDRTNFPPPGAILFAGDSQFFRWKTIHEDFPGFNIINRGIDGYETRDLLYFADRIALPYKPRLIVLNAGGNDVHNGRSSEAILANLKAFIAKARAALPNVPIVVCGLSPGPNRWSEANRRVEANQILKDYAASQPGLTFIDVWQPMLTPAGQPRPDLWMDDGIHSNHAGYLIRAQLLLPALGSPK